MQKIDRLGWAAGLAFEAYGVRAGIRVNDAALLPELLRQLPPAWKLLADPVVPRLYSFWAGGPPPRPGFRRYEIVYRGSLALIKTMDRREALDTLASDLRIYVAERSRRYVFLHAGVVSWRGRAIVLPGRSFSGKSQLVASLVRAGATYHSDEYAPLDARGRVHPYALPLTLRAGEGVVRQSAEQLGGRAATEPIAVGLVVMSRFRSGGRWRPRLLSGGRALLALMHHTIPIRRQPARALRILRRVVSQVPILDGPRGDAKDVVPYLLARVEDARASTRTAARKLR